MAEESGQEKTEDPTGKRLSDARGEGQVPRSKELNTFIILIASSAALILTGRNMVAGLGEIMRTGFMLEREEIFDRQALVRHFGDAMLDAAGLLWPLVLILVVASVIGPVSVSGWAFSGKALQPRLEKLNPVKGIARLFGVQGLVELLKSIVKFLLLIGITILLFIQALPHLAGLGNESLRAGIVHGGWIIMFAFLVLSASVGLIALIDVPFQLWDHKRKLKMTRQEVKDEMKDIEGRPEVKNRIRALQMEAARGRMMEEVPKADVIVTNPTHYAVALRYEQQGDSAPKVVAKGMNLVAAHIRNLANGSGVIIVSAPPLARALYHSTELDSEIPDGLFVAVAQVLAYVYQLKAARSGAQVLPELPQDLPIPNEYRVDESR